VLDRILADERKLQFSIVEEELKLTGLRPANPSKAKKPRKGAEGQRPLGKGKRGKGKRRR
jgi:hypothetical protein